MEGEKVEQTGGNSQEAPAASPSAEAQSAKATPPAGEHPAADKGSEHRIPHSRFNEVIDQRNRERELREKYERKIAELESRVPGGPSDAENALVKRLEDLGMAEEAAREVVRVQRDAARLEKADIENRLRHYEVSAWSNSLAQKHKDYQELLPEMEKAFNSMSEVEQNLVVASPRGLETLYKSVKADLLEKKLEEKYNQGADDAYRNKGLKAAVSSVPGGSAVAPTTKLSRKAISEMDVETYRKRLPEINAWLQSGAKE